MKNKKKTRQRQEKTRPQLTTKAPPSTSGSSHKSSSQVGPDGSSDNLQGRACMAQEAVDETDKQREGRRGAKIGYGQQQQQQRQQQQLKQERYPEQRRRQKKKKNR